MTLNPQRPRISPSGALEVASAAVSFRIQDDSALLAEEPALNIINGTLADDPGVATDLTLHYQTLLNADGGAMPQEPTTFFGADFLLDDDALNGRTRITAPNIGVARAEAATAQAAADAAQTSADTAQTSADAAQFLAVGAQATADQALSDAVLAQPANTYFVDQSVAVDAAPYFSTIQAAIDAMFLLVGNILPGRIVLAFGGGYAENLSFPNGLSVELACPSLAESAILEPGATIIGTLTDPAAANLPRTIILTNVRVSGNITFTGTGAGSSLRVSTTAQVAVLGNVSLGAVYRFYVTGQRPGFSLSPTTGGYTGTYQGFAAVTGNITCAALALFNASLSTSGKTFVAAICEFNNSKVTGGTFTCPSVTFINSSTSAACAFSGLVRADNFSAGFLVAKGCTAVGALSLLDASVTKGPTAFANNVALANVAPAGIPVAGTYEIKVNLVRTVAGTAGVASFNVAATDAAGAFTLPVCVLDVAVLARASGSLIFSTAGAVAIQFSITGIVTPGALAATYEMVLRKLDSQVA